MNTKRLFVFLLTSILLLSCSKGGDSQSAPATVEQAAQILNLADLELIPGSEEPRQRNLASLSYQAAAPVQQAYDFYKKNLETKGWNELPNGYVMDQMASSAFANKDFKVSLTIMPSSKSGFSDVVIQQHGNLDLAKMSFAKGLTSISAFPLTAIYLSDKGVAETAEENKKLLTADGWVSYGTAGESQYYKKNAVLLKIMTSASPAQAGKTTVSLTDILLSADLPTMPEAQQINYSESNQTLTFNSTKTKEAIFEYYKQELPKTGWTLSSKEVIDFEGKDTITFRNKLNDLIALGIIKNISNENIVSIELMTARQIDEMNKRLDAQAAAYKAKNYNK